VEELVPENLWKSTMAATMEFTYEKKK